MANTQITVLPGFSNFSNQQSIKYKKYNQTKVLIADDNLI
jgi:hypothetical protein